jgi:hypothetical protein
MQILGVFDAKTLLAGHAASLPCAVSGLHLDIPSLTLHQRDGYLISHGRRTANRMP